MVVDTPSAEAVVATHSVEEAIPLAEADTRLVGEAIRSGEGSRSGEVSEWEAPVAASEEAI